MWMPLFYHASSARSTPPRQVRLSPNYLLWAAEERAGLCPCRSRSESRQLLIHQTQKMQIPSMLPLLSSPLVSFSSLPARGAVSPRPEQASGFLGRWHLASPTTFNLLQATFCAAQLPADRLHRISSEVALHGVLTAPLQG